MSNVSIRFECIKCYMDYMYIFAITAFTFLKFFLIRLLSYIFHLPQHVLLKMLSHSKLPYTTSVWRKLPEIESELFLFATIYRGLYPENLVSRYFLHLTLFPGLFSYHNNRRSENIAI